MNNQRIGIIIGYICGSMIICANIAQIIKIIKDKTGAGLSPVFLSLFLAITFGYTISGFLIDIQFVYVINIISFTETAIMMCLVIYYQRLNKKKQLSQEYTVNKNFANPNSIELQETKITDKTHILIESAHEETAPETVININ